MSKVITSDIEGFKGKVTFHQPLNFDQVFAIEDAKDKAVDIEPSSYWTMVNTAMKVLDDGGEVKKLEWSSRGEKFFIEAILACAEKFELENIPEKPTVETFPMTPRSASHKLIQFLWEEINKIYDGEIEVPNAS